MGIPKYPFRVLVDYKLKDTVTQIAKNFEHLVQAEDYASKERRKPYTRRVQVMCVLDDVVLHGTGFRYDDTGRR
jgi:hypothetical protein